ncbi:SDR family NAD(P)-dependent oxidoreductase [Roseomonas nepalensis]|uniref:SDR family NAD(P)-dependent oxidoreductase n=1 Tax=Muricoccus nepalensis TaxID=1854500 RepID=A0A502FAI3_9PROT|nr:SDR family NAD(P)-dependent oxidoreductase [Roseomonas nepalensis]TPG46387.1 SDR family NAD(P)-dependent oxidoreductase [Roseomonas nepalensis]
MAWRWAALAVLGALVAGCSAPSELGGGDRALVAGRTYVVTGASSGFGRGVAERLGGYGANVVLAARREAVLEEVASAVRAGGGQALVVPTDVSDPAQVERLAAAAVGRFGRIDAWVNNAAVASIGRFEEVPLADHARVVDVNLKGAIYGSHAALRRFRAQGAGVLVNVSSVEGRVPVALHASYAATKAGLIALGAAIEEELRGAGLDGAIRVSTVEPWAVDTPFWDHAGNYTGRASRMTTMDGPEAVVDAVVWMSIHPETEYAVGWKARGAVLGSRIAPRWAERLAGAVVRRAQLEEAPPGPVGPGAVHAPVAAGTGVEGGVRARMAAERDAAGVRP